MVPAEKRNPDKKLDKNLQDDWLPDQQRRSEATSKEIPEYGGDLKRKDTLNINPSNPPSQQDPATWKKKNV